MNGCYYGVNWAEYASSNACDIFPKVASRSMDPIGSLKKPLLKGIYSMDIGARGESTL